MTDGWDDESAYGHINELPVGSSLGATSTQQWFGGGGGKWSAGGEALDAPAGTRPPAPGYANAPLRSVRMVARNSGLFFLSATREALRLMEILAQRMASEDVWGRASHSASLLPTASSAQSPLTAWHRVLLRRSGTNQLITWRSSERLMVSMSHLGSPCAR